MKAGGFMYKTQIFCIIVLLFIGAFYWTNRKATDKVSKWFLILLGTSIIQLIFDVITVYTVNHLETVPPLINRWAHNCYLGLMLTVFYLAYKYLENVLVEETGNESCKMKGSFIPWVLTMMGVIFLPLVYIENPKTNYSHGPAAIMVYIGVAAYIILIVRIMMKYGNLIPVRKKRAMKIALLSEVPIALYQMVVPTSLITCFGMVLLNLGIYLTVENPDAALVELLEKETKRADIANQAKTNFLANMSHEIRTPINAVLGMNEIILRESKEPAIREYAKDVQGAAKSLLSIINDILDITKIEAGKLTIIPTEYGFSSMIHDVTNMISFKAKAKDLEFIVDIDEQIPSELFGDDIRIRQILVNLLNNAVKYTHKGTVTLTVKLLSMETVQEESVSKEKGSIARILFSVKDTGIGIKEEDIQKLFIPFERIEEKRNRNIEGTGLGMNITMQLLDLFGSKLEVKSVYGEGSTFSFVLEQGVVNQNPIGKLGDMLKNINVEPKYQVSFEAPEAKILVVDDNEMNRKVFCGLLKNTKIQISEASSGEEALEKVKETMFDIIFMDHMMPGMDGVEAFRIMHSWKDYPCKDTPVVILTANAIVGAKEQYLAEGFEAFLSKPIDSSKLEEMVEELLDGRLVYYVEREMEEAVTEKSGFNTDDLPIVDGLDWRYAASHFDSKEDMLNIVRFFLSALIYDAEELNGYYTELENEEMLKNYRTKVHSMKSSAAIIGIVPLAGMAKVLENAARDGDVTTIRQLHSVFIQNWLEYKENLKPFAKEQTGNKKATDFPNEINAILQEMKAAAEDMDIDGMDEGVKKLEEYQFEGEQAEFFENIKRAAINLDAEFFETVEEF